MYERIHTEIVTAPQSQIILSNNLNGGIVPNIDGDRDEEYWCRFWIINDDAPSTREFKVRPNGVTTETFTTVVTISNTFDAPTGNTELIYSRVNDPQLSGVFKLRTLADPGGGVDFPRFFWGDSGRWQNTLGITTTFRQYYNGIWDPAVINNITSLEFVSTAPASTVPVPAIGIGSRIELWRLVRDV